jgi:hypothetical protein
MLQAEEGAQTSALKRAKAAEHVSPLSKASPAKLG